MNAIRIIITGGTFDRHKNTRLPEILKTVRITVPINLELNRLVTSLDMDEADHSSILASCRKASEEYIIVLHGTDTMTETARMVGEAHLKKRIVFTGDRVPYTVTGSDAFFNLGAAVTAVQLVQPGVWIVMNGRIFPVNHVHKDRRKGFFEKTPPIHLA